MANVAHKEMVPMKRFLTVLIAFLLSVPAYGQVNIVTVPGTSNVTVGSEFDVIVQVQAGAQQVDAAASFINFDPAKLQVVSITAGGTLPVPLQSTHDNSAGTLGYSAGTFSSFPTGTFTLCTIRFSAIATTSGATLAFNAIDPRKTDALRAGASVLSSATNGSVVASAATSPTEEPTATPTETIEATHTPTNTSTPTESPTPTATVELEPCPGDCDRDGQVSAAEVLQVIYSALDDHSAPCLDGNGDGVLTVEDVVLAGCE